jgi:putative addiction module component (TIGR02574 family)
MPETLEQWKEQLGTLPAHERAEIAQFLIHSLDDDDEDEDPAEVEAAWAAELDRRADEILSGKAVGRPAEEVFKELREKYS